MFSWHIEHFTVGLIYLAAKLPSIQSLAASHQENKISLALYTWRLLLVGWLPSMIFLAVLVLSLADFGCQ
jgi:hypothetical protein